MLLNILGAILIRIMLAVKGVVRVEEGIIRDANGSNLSSFKKKLLPLHPLTNFEIQKHYKNEPRFTGVYSRDNLPDQIKDRAYVINIEEISDIGAHWIALYVNAKVLTYFDSFEVNNISQEIKKFAKRSIDKLTFITNNFRIQAYGSVTCYYFCIKFFNFMIKGKNLTYFSNLYSPNDFKKKKKK